MVIDREELYSKESWELYMKFQMEFFGQLELKFDNEDGK